MITLDEATTEQLAETLLSRFEAAHFVGYRDIPGQESCGTFVVRVGPTPFCEGLLRSAFRMLMVEESDLRGAGTDSWEE